MPRFLRPLIKFLSWPGGRFPEFRRRYYVALTHLDARVVVRGALGTDPMYLPVMEGIAAHHRSDVVGAVDDDGRMQLYIGNKYATGLGLVGRITPHDQGSRITTRVAWTGLSRWLVPVSTAVVALAFGIGTYDLAVNEGRPIVAAMTWVVVVLVRILLAFEAGRKARRWELPTLVAHLHKVLEPHLTETRRAG